MEEAGYPLPAGEEAREATSLARAWGQVAPDLAHPPVPASCCLDPSFLFDGRHSFAAVRWLLLPGGLPRPSPLNLGAQIRNGTQ